MWPLPVSELYMAGRSSVEILKKLEINTIGDLARSEEALIELHLKSHGRMLWEFANGIGDDQVQSVPDEAKESEIQRHWRKMQSPMKKQKKC